MYSAFRSSLSCLLLFNVFCSAFRLGHGIKIQQLWVPAAVENGTVPAVILDCDFTYEPKDTFSLVVQWFLNGGVKPVYQWIPPQEPQALGVLADRVDLSFLASDDNYTMHRAIRIVKPTAELSGEYQCYVFSYDSEDKEKRSLVIYAPAKFVTVRQYKPTDDTVNISCHALGLYPKPTAEMSIYKGRKQSRAVVAGTSLVVNNLGGHYDVTLYKVFQDSSLASETVFECVFGIPGTSYTIRDMLTYYPGMHVALPKPTSYVKSLVMSTEPTLIGVLTVADSGGSERRPHHSWTASQLLWVFLASVTASSWMIRDL